MSSDNKDLELQPGSFQKRFLATALDFVVCGFLGLIIGGLLGLMLGSPALIMPFYVFFFSIAYFINSFLYQMKTGRTFGKYVLNIKVCYPNLKVDTRNEDIMKREMAKLFTFVTCGYSFFSKYKEDEIIAFHDDYSKTVVLNLSEDHEEYLHEYHYDTYFHSQEEEEEYEQSKKEAEELLKQQRAEEKKQKELEKKSKKQNKKGQEDNVMVNSPNNNVPLNQNQQTVFMHNQTDMNNISNTGQQPVMNDFSMDNNLNNPNGQFANNMNASLNINDNPNGQIPSMSDIPTMNEVPQTGQMIPDLNNQQQPMMDNSPMGQEQFNPNMNDVPTMNNAPMGEPNNSGINIVGNIDFIDNTQSQEKKEKGKLGGLFGSKSSKKKKDNASDMSNQSGEEPIQYYDHKMSSLVQDNTYLPSQNIFSEYYKGWSVKEDLQSHNHKLASKKK